MLRLRNEVINDKMGVTNIGGKNVKLCVGLVYVCVDMVCVFVYVLIWCVFMCIGMVCVCVCVLI